MGFSEVAVFSRGFVIERENEEFFETADSAKVFVNGSLVKETKENVISVFSLKPDTVYDVKVVDKTGTFEKKVITKCESVLLNVRAFGARGDGTSDDTGSISCAIASCLPGGTVFVPEGTYLVRPLFMKDNITLYLDKGAVLLGETDRTKYPILPGMVFSEDWDKEENFGSWEGNPLDQFASLITGVGVKDIAVIGEGTIDGNAKNSDWWVDVRVKRIAWRPNLIFLNRCKNPVFAGITIKNSPCWAVHPYYSEDVRFLNLHIENPPDSPNTDGIDPESCINTLILGTTISVGDDCVAIKSGKLYMARQHFRRTNNVTVRNCRFERGHGGVTIGSEISGGVENVYVTKSIFKDTDRGIRVKSRRGRGGRAHISGIVCENMLMDGVRMPLTVNMFYFCDPDGHSPYVQNQEALPVDEGTPSIGSIEFRNLTCKNTENCFVCAYGLPERHVERIAVKNVNVSFLPPDKRRPVLPVMMDNFPEMAGKSMFLKNIESVEIENVVMEGQDIESPEFINVGNLKTKDLSIA